MAGLTFDATYYLSTYPDVATAVSQGAFASAEQHYELHGATELRNPNSIFNALEYAAQNPDVVNAVSAGTMPSVWFHFVTHGAAEGRAPSTAFSSFDAAGYLAANPDVQTAVDAGTMPSALYHFLAHGIDEGRTGSGVDVSDGQTFTLTTSVNNNGQPDNLMGTANADTFNGLLTNSFEVGDVIDGAGGTDTLNARLSKADAGSIDLGETKNVENVYLRLLLDTNNDEGAGAFTADLTSLSGVTQLWTQDLNSQGAGDSIEYDNIAAASTAVGIKGGVAATQGSIIYDFSDASGSGDTATVVFDSARVKDVTMNGMETLTVSTQAGASRVDGNWNATEAETVTITGDQNLTVDATDFAAKVAINGSGMTGALDITLENSVTTFTGGTGDDTVAISDGALVTSGANADSFDGGDGTDTFILVETPTAAPSLTDTAAEVNKLSNFEVFGVRASTTVGGTDNTLLNIKLSDFTGISSFVLIGDAATGDSNFNNAGTLAVTGVESSDTVTATADLTDAAGTAGAVGSGGTAGAAGTAASGGAIAFTGQGVGQTAVLVLDSSGDLGAVEIAGGAGGNGGNGENEGSAAGGAGGAGGAAAEAIGFGAGINTLNIVSNGDDTNTITGGAGGNGGTGGDGSGDSDSDSGGAGGAGGAASAAIANGAQVQSVSITGSADLTISGGVAGSAGTAGSSSDGGAAGAAGAAELAAFSGAVGMDASAFEGKLTTGGSTGDDTITLSTAVSKSDTFVFGADTANGTDTIKNFAVGDGGDKLDVAGVLSTTMTAVNTDLVTGNDNALADDDVQFVVMDTKSKDFSGGDFGDLFANGKTFSTTTGASDKGIVIVIDDDGDSATHVYAFEDGGDGTLVAGEVELIGLLEGISGSTNPFTADNFVLV